MMAESQALRTEYGDCSIREGDNGFLKLIRRMPPDTACTTKDFMSSKELADVLGLGKAITGVTYHPKEDRWVFRSIPKRNEAA
jgi:hypothetical protein